MKVSCFLQTLTSNEDNNNPLLTNLTQSSWNEIKLQKVDPKLMDEQLKVQFALELNPNFVQMTGISSENLLIRWKEQNPDKRLFDLELHEDNLIKGQIEDQGQFMTELKWLKRAEIKLNIRFNCFSAQFMDNPNTTFLLYAKIFNIRTSELIDTVCCQIKIQENRPKSVKLIHLEQIQLQEYSDVKEIGNVVDEVNNEIDENVVTEEIQTVVETANVVNANDISNSHLDKINSKPNISDTKISTVQSYYKWLLIVIVTNLLRILAIYILYVDISYKSTKAEEIASACLLAFLFLAYSFCCSFRLWIRLTHATLLPLILVNFIDSSPIRFQNIPEKDKVFIYWHIILLGTTFVSNELIATILYLVAFICSPSMFPK